VAAAGAVLDLGNAQQGAEGHQQALGLAQGRVDGLRVFFFAQAAPLGAFQPGDQAGERGAQVMGDVVAHAFHLAHQPFQLVEHAVDHSRDTVDVVVAAAHRQALAEVALDNAADGVAQGVQAQARGVAQPDRA